jgi:ABC-type Na+ efflux pump permease subunit
MANARRHNLLHKLRRIFKNRILRYGLVVILILAIFGGGTAVGMHIKEPAIKNDTERVATLSAQLKQAQTTSKGYKTSSQMYQQLASSDLSNITRLNSEIKQLSSETNTKVVYVQTPQAPIAPGLCANGQMEGGIVSCN